MKSPAAQAQTPRFVEDLPKIIKEAKEYAYKVENLCDDENLKRKIVKWSLASPLDVARVKDEVEEAYRQCLKPG